MEAILAPNTLLLSLSKSSLASFVELKDEEEKESDSTVRVILRDIAGKYCWDCQPLRGPDQWEEDLEELRRRLLPMTREKTSPQSPEKRLSDVNPDAAVSPAARAALAAGRQRSEDKDTSLSLRGRGEDHLDGLLHYLSVTSPECLPADGRHLNVLAPLESSAEREAMANVTAQRNLEAERQRERRPQIREATKRSPSSSRRPSPFQDSRRLIHQLGLASWEQRKNAFLLRKDERLLRELKNLDAKR